METTVEYERLNMADTLARSLARLKCFSPSLIEGQPVDCKDLTPANAEWSHGLCERCLAWRYIEQWPVSVFTEWLRRMEARKNEPARSGQ